MYPLFPAGLYATLVVDPRGGDAARIAAGLTALGFPARAVERAETALRCAESRYFPVVVVVADLGDEDCHRFLESMHRTTPRSWVIVANLRIDAALQRLVFRHGGDALMSAPVDIRALAGRIAAFQLRGRPLIS